jgi:hypothetical protein
MVKRLVIQVLQEADEPLLPAEVRRRIEERTGEQLPKSSVKDCLFQGARHQSGTFNREATGYRLVTPRGPSRWNISLE